MAGDDITLATLAIEAETDVVAARQQAKRIAGFMGFEEQDQTRIATAVSEIARNAYEYARGGRVAFMVCPASNSEKDRQALVVRIADQGPGIADIDAILLGEYRSRTGMGLGLIGARRLSDRLSVETSPGSGTVVTIEKWLPRRKTSLGSAQITQVSEALADVTGLDPIQTIADQNRELIRSLDDVRLRQEELNQLNQELEDTNRGVVALYAELDARAEQLREASELKSRFLSNVSHEFRTPLNSILALTRLLLDRVDGELTPEQQKQVGFIRRSAESLSELTNDLLDLAKVEAGKTEIRPSRFSVSYLFAALRGVLRPLRQDETVALNFIEKDGPFPDLITDEAKVAQILRNLVSNALKFTRAGHVDVLASYFPEADRVIFEVADTGIGIAREDQERIFEEFAQINNSLQKANKGTGLGLPLSRRFAELLGGELTVRSMAGQGSVFTLSLPRRFAGADNENAPEPASIVPVEDALQRKFHVLVIDDDDTFRYVLRQRLSTSRFLRNAVDFHEAPGGAEGLRLAFSGHFPVHAVVLDLQMAGLDGYGTLEAIAANPAMAGVSVIVMTSGLASAIDRGRLRRADAVISKDQASLDLLEQLLQEHTQILRKAS